jgi:hypothetical protein
MPAGCWHYATASRCLSTLSGQTGGSPTVQQPPCQPRRWSTIAAPPAQPTCLLPACSERGALARRGAAGSGAPHIWQPPARCQQQQRRPRPDAAQVRAALLVLCCRRCCACTGVLACAALSNHTHSMCSHLSLQAAGGRLGRGFSWRHQQPRRAAGGGHAAPVCRPAWQSGDAERWLLGWLAKVPCRTALPRHCVKC